MNHENTDIYKKALSLVGDCLPIAKRMPPGFAYLGDQLRRAATSVPFTFAEGCRRKSAKDRAHYFDMSKGSAREVSSVIDVAHIGAMINDDERALVKDKCDHICAMLHNFR
jgi:four helix bundle protein